MGDRGQVLIKPLGVYLYTHWGASELGKTVQTALKKGWRWDDSEYLTRIIFDVMVDKDQGNETGYGIGTYLHSDIYKLVEVDTDNQTVSIKHIDSKDKHTILYEGSFNEFVEQKY